MWERNGHISVPVEQTHIDIALARSSSHCTVAEAIAERIPDARHIAVDLQTIRFTRKGLRYCFLTPRLAQDIIIATDLGETEKLRPVVLRLRAAIISKAGKKRHAPTNQELRGSGITINKTQPHLPQEETPATPGPDQRHLPDGRRNTDVDRSDGLAKPLPVLHKDDRGIVPQPQRRKPQARVSNAAKGSVPVTLGGRMPPVSILSRREFGLRQLRR